MINYPTAKAKDQRVSFRDHRISDGDANVWAVTGRFDPASGRMKVHRIEGDVTKPAALRDALSALANEIGFAVMIKA